jgi:transcriptional regulator with XRE-family HTH domain
MTISERIKEVRLSLRLSQRAFAEAIFISNGHYAGIELGYNEVNDRLIHLIVSVFAVNKQWLLTGEGRMFNSASEQRLEKLTRLFNELRPEFQDFVLRQIDELIELQNIRRDDGAQGRDVRSEGVRTED